LGLRQGHDEANLQATILSQLEAFILELGWGFAFVERQKADGLGLFLCAESIHEKVKLLQMQKRRHHQGQIFATGSNERDTVRGYGIMFQCRYPSQPPKTRFLLSSSEHLH
jgi:hypothetical protein